MKYVIGIIFIVPILTHTISFAQFNWSRGNKRGAVGCWVMSVLSLLSMAVLVLLR